MSLAAQVLADEPVAGVGERVAALPDDPEAAAALLASGLSADGVALAVDRGMPDVARRIVERLRGRRNPEELGEAAASVELLGLHVPPAGRAALSVRRSAVADRQVSITALGFGFGGGRKLTIAIDEDIPERGACMRVVQHVVLRVRRYVTDTEPLLSTDVVGWGGRELVAWPDCPHCGALPDLSPLEFEEDAERALDLRAFDAPVTRETSFTLEGTRRADIGLDLPLPGVGRVNAGFQLEQRTSIECSATYTFPAGRAYVPYRRRGEAAVLPFWIAR